MREQKKKEKVFGVKSISHPAPLFPKNVNIWTEFPNLSQIMHGGKAQMCGSIGFILRHLCS